VATVGLDAWFTVQPGLGPAQRVANVHGYLVPQNRIVVPWGIGLADALFAPPPATHRGTWC
jgi:hypothetical protein